MMTAVQGHRNGQEARNGARRRGDGLVGPSKELVLRTLLRFFGFHNKGKVRPSIPVFDFTY